MKKPGSMKALEDMGRARLSESFFLRDFLHSEIADFYGMSNIPDDPDLAIEAGSRLCEELLERLRAGQSVAVAFVEVKRGGIVATAFSKSDVFHFLNSGAATLANRLAASTD